MSLSVDHDSRTDDRTASCTKALRSTHAQSPLVTRPRAPVRACYPEWDSWDANSEFEQRT